MNQNYTQDYFSNKTPMLLPKEVVLTTVPDTSKMRMEQLLDQMTTQHCFFEMLLVNAVQKYKTHIGEGQIRTPHQVNSMSKSCTEYFKAHGGLKGTWPDNLNFV